MSTLRSADHDRAMHDDVAAVTRIEYPTQHVLRFTAVLPEADPAWTGGNVRRRGFF